MCCNGHSPRHRPLGLWSSRVLALLAWWALAPGAAAADPEVTVVTLGANGTTQAGESLVLPFDGSVRSDVWPQSVSVSSDGTVLVCDRIHHRVFGVDAVRGVLWVVAGSGDPGYVDGEAQYAQFRSPNFVLATAGGKILVADYGNGAVRQVVGSRVLTVASQQTGFLRGPVALAVSDDDSALYASDSFFGHVVRLTAEDPGNWSKGWLRQEVVYSNIVGAPRGIVLMGGLLFVSEIFSYTVLRLSEAETAPGTWTISTELGTYNRPGRVASINGSNNTIIQDVKVNTAYGMARGLNNSLIIVDSVNNHVMQWSVDSQWATVVAGQGEFGTRDGPGGVAQFQQPAGVAVSTSGKIYVADTGNGLVRAVMPACAEGSFRFRDESCRACVDCGAGYYEEQPCGLAWDAVCSLCISCPSGFYATTQCDGVRNTECASCSVCKEGFEAVHQCTALEDTVCEETGLPGWAIALIVIASLLVALGALSHYVVRTNQDVVKALVKIPSRKRTTIGSSMMGATGPMDAPEAKRYMDMLAVPSVHYPSHWTFATSQDPFFRAREPLELHHMERLECILHRAGAPKDILAEVGYRVENAILWRAFAHRRQQMAIGFMTAQPKPLLLALRLDKMSEAVTAGINEGFALRIVDEQTGMNVWQYGLRALTAQPVVAPGDQMPSAWRQKAKCEDGYCFYESFQTALTAFKEEFGSSSRMTVIVARVVCGNCFECSHGQPMPTEFLKDDAKDPCEEEKHGRRKSVANVTGAIHDAGALAKRRMSQMPALLAAGAHPGKPGPGAGAVGRRMSAFIRPSLGSDGAGAGVKPPAPGPGGQRKSILLPMSMRPNGGVTATKWHSARTTEGKLVVADRYHVYPSFILTCNRSEPLQIMGDIVTPVPPRPLVGGQPEAPPMAPCMLPPAVDHKDHTRMGV
mmetsp:Transcript_94639/g.216488  ORF Transcript_94639/g.216488 Transcript_94639/m.216488 type:complete len:918 (+) Transcript_94639:3-2756(+)